MADFQYSVQKRHAPISGSIQRGTLLHCECLSFQNVNPILLL